jgi:SEC-C motif domain protein
MESCPCGSGRDFSECCSPYLAGTATPPTAEALMRSRYSAYVKNNIKYIIDTCVRSGTNDVDVDETRKWSEESTWKGLKILRVEEGGATDSKGIVEFVATYSQKGIQDEHHEIARFVKKLGHWLYDEGDIVPVTIRREGPKVGRNDPCPCGNGKKYKQCCGKGA